MLGHGHGVFEDSARGAESVPEGNDSVGQVGKFADCLYLREGVREVLFATSGECIQTLDIRLR
jgi:hypothetical protein